MISKPGLRRRCLHSSRTPHPALVSLQAMGRVVTTMLMAHQDCIWRSNSRSAAEGQQLVLELLLKWPGKGGTRGQWSDLPSAGSCLLHTGLSTPEFFRVGQQWASNFLPDCGTRLKYAPESGFSWAGAGNPPLILCLGQWIESSLLQPQMHPAPCYKSTHEAGSAWTLTFVMIHN